MPPAKQGGKTFAPTRPLLNQPALTIDNLPSRIQRGDCNVLPPKFYPPQCMPSQPPPCTPMCLPPPCTPYGQPCMPQQCMPQPCMPNCYYPCCPPPPPMCPPPCPPVLVCPPNYCTPYPSMPPPQCCPPPPCPPPPCQPCVPRCCTARSTCCGNSGGCCPKQSCCPKKCCGGPKQIVCLPKGTKPIVGCGVAPANTAMKKTCQSLGATKPTIGDQPASYNNCNFYLSEIPKALKDRFGISMGGMGSSCEDTEETEETESSCADEEVDECIQTGGINRAAGDDQVVHPPMGYPGSDRAAWGAGYPADGSGPNGNPCTPYGNFGNGMGGPNGFGNNGWGTAGGPGGPYSRGMTGGGPGGPYGRGRGRGGPGGRGMGRGGPGGRGRGRGGHGGPNGRSGRDGNGDPYGRNGGGNDPYGRNGTGNDPYGRNGTGNDPYGRNGTTRDGTGKSGGLSTRTSGRGGLNDDMRRASGRSATSAAFSQLSGYRDHHYSEAELTNKSMNEQGINDEAEGDERLYDQPFTGSSVYNQKGTPYGHGTTQTSRITTPVSGNPSDVYGQKLTQTSHYQGSARTGAPSANEKHGTAQPSHQDSGYRTGGNRSINTYRGSSEPALNRLSQTPGDGDVPVYRTSTQTQLKIVERQDEDPEIHVVQRPVQEVIGYQQDPNRQHSQINLDIYDGSGFGKNKKAVDPCDNKGCLIPHTRRLHRLCSFSHRRAKRLSQLHKPLPKLKAPPCPIRETMASIMRKRPPANCKWHENHLPAYHEFCTTDRHKDMTNRYPLLTLENEKWDTVAKKHAMQRKGVKRKLHHR